MNVSRSKMNLAVTSGSSPPPKIEELENQISDGIRCIKSTWVAVGLSLGIIRDERLYLPLTFDDYLASKPEWEITRRHADRIIKSAKIADAVNQTKMSDWLPDVPNESVARALDGLPLEEQAVVYSTACEIAGEGSDPTAKDVGVAISDLGRTSGSSPPEDATDGDATEDSDPSAISDLGRTSGSSPPNEPTEVEIKDSDSSATNVQGSRKYPVLGIAKSQRPISLTSGKQPRALLLSPKSMAKKSTKKEEFEPLSYYEVSIECSEMDRTAVQAALLDFHISENPLGTKHRCKCSRDEASDLLTSLGLVVKKLTGTIDLRVRGAA